MRADIAVLESLLVKLWARRFQQVERHPHIALNLQQCIGAHNAAGNLYAAEFTNLNRGTIHKRKTQDIVQTGSGRNSPRLKIRRRLARKGGFAPLALQSGAQSRLVFVVSLDMHRTTVGRQVGCLHRIAVATLGIPVIRTGKHVPTCIALCIPIAQAMCPRRPGARIPCRAKQGAAAIQSGIVCGRLVPIPPALG